MKYHTVGKRAPLKDAYARIEFQNSGCSFGQRKELPGRSGLLPEAAIALIAGGKKPVGGDSCDPSLSRLWHFESAVQLGIIDLLMSRNRAGQKLESVAAPPSHAKKHATLPASLRPEILETEGGMEILSQEQEQDQVQEPIAEQYCGNGSRVSTTLTVRKC